MDFQMNEARRLGARHTPAAEIGMVNAVLDALARQSLPAEFGRRRSIKARTTFRKRLATRIVLLRLPFRCESVPQRDVFLVWDRATRDDLVDIKHRVRVGSERRPLGQPRSVRIAMGREVDPRARNGTHKFT